VATTLPSLPATAPVVGRRSFFGGLIRTRKARRRTVNGLTIFSLCVGALFVLLPLFWLIDTAFKPAQLAFQIPPHFFYRPTLANFRTLISGQDSQYFSDLGHSLILMVSSVLVALVLGIPAGYSLARSRFRGSKTITVWLIIAYITPALVYIVPLYAIYQKLNLTGSYLSLILYYETFELPLTIFLMRSYFSDVPRELDEAARIDGCTRWLAFRKVILPLVWPGIATVTILVAMSSWGEYFGALIFAGPSTTTAPVAIQNYIGLDSSNWSAMAAAACFLVVPVLALTAFAQRGYMRQIQSASTG
jgi:multiple sugar transport system permease protein